MFFSMGFSISTMNNYNYVGDMEVSKVMEVPPNHPFIDGIFHYKPAMGGTTHTCGNLHF
jgi:3-hydroxymyristoyl/3-hydroxydecanoyl-(acyl carrier protein) dehydratase